jgi:hypothetical protein
MLLEILNYLRREKIASNHQIARQFALDLSALEPMLDCWVNKGKLKICEQNSTCNSSCFKCKAQPPRYYQYKRS